MSQNEALFTAITKGNRKIVEEQVNACVAAGGNVVELLTGTMIPAMRTIGERFSRNEVYVPEMLIAARAMGAGLKIIEPILAKAGHKPLGKVCVGTVKGDLHDIGKNLVAMMLKGAGYEVEDLGVDCDTAKFQAAVDRGAQAVLCSALLTTTMPYMKTVTEALKGKNVKVVIGGAPVTQQYANDIGAHGYGEDANSAVKVVDALLAVGR
ncbi:MAG: cobalamin-binding protein [Verrucomicrobia bacterium]|nr:MAG: cobalamin-binding protein [Verrucomicrobiota bacterium]